MKAKLTLEIIDDLENLGDGKKTRSYSTKMDINMFQLASLKKIGVEPIKHVLQSLSNELGTIIKTEV